MARSKEIGCVFEMDVDGVYAYALCTHKHKMYGGLIRVFSGVFDTHQSAGDVIKKPVLFSCFFPLSSAISMGLVSVVGHVETPVDLEAFPIFRSGVPDRDTRKVKVWSLWDGVSSKVVGGLSEDQKMIPILETINYTLLINRIKSGWTSGRDVTT